MAEERYGQWPFALLTDVGVPYISIWFILTSNRQRSNTLDPPKKGKAFMLQLSGTCRLAFKCQSKKSQKLNLKQAMLNNGKTKLNVKEKKLFESIKFFNR